MGFGGPVIKEGLILVISIVILQNYYGDLGDVCGKYPVWVKVPGPLDYLIILTPYITMICVITDIRVLGIPLYKKSIASVILDCYTPKLRWLRPR